MERGGRGAAHEIAGSGALLAEDRLLGGRQLLQGRRARPKLVLFESVYVDTAFGSDEPDAHSAHTEHDHRRYEPGGDRAADHEPVGERPADAMRHHDRTRAGRKMREDEECCEPIMRHEADVPWVLDQPGWRAGGEAPSGVDAKICPCEYEDRVHVAQHVKGEV